MFALLWISSLILPFFQNLMNASKCKVVITNTESFTVIKSTRKKISAHCLVPRFSLNFPQYRIALQRQICRKRRKLNFHGEQSFQFCVIAG